MRTNQSILILTRDDLCKGRDPENPAITDFNVSREVVNKAPFILYARGHNDNIVLKAKYDIITLYRPEAETL